MKLTTKGRYAVMAMADLALFKDNGPINLTDISLRQNISLAYLEQIFIKLKKNNLVKSVRGAKGGYVLEISPEEIKSLYQINTLSTVISVEFGVHILPNLVFSIKPCLVRRGTYETSATLKHPDIESENYRDVRITTYEGQSINTKWGFENLYTGSTNYPIYFGLKLKL